MPLHVAKIITSAPFIFKPVDKRCKLSEVFAAVETEPTRLHFNELFDHFLFRDISKNYMLWVFTQDTKSIWNQCLIFLFSSHDTFGQNFPCIGVLNKTRVIGYFPDKTITGNDVTFYYFTEVIKAVPADHQPSTNSCAPGLILLLNVYIN